MKTRYDTKNFKKAAALGVTNEKWKPLWMCSKERMMTINSSNKKYEHMQQYTTYASQIPILLQSC